MNPRKGKDEDAPEPSPFSGIQKSTVLREARIFNEPQLNPSRCTGVLTKILYLISQGEKFSAEEATEVFFSVTKLFQSQDAHLRRMIYLVIKELKIDSDESLIVVSCLSKDMTSKTDLFRANSIRVLAKIMDASMVGGIERFLKQAILDQNPFIASSTLIAGQYLHKSCSDIIKRWTNEVHQALTSKSHMAQYHALGLLHKIKQHDRLAVSKIVSALARKPPKGALAQCLQIRLMANVMTDMPSPPAELVEYLVHCLQNKDPLVKYEAARVMADIPSLTAVQVAPVIRALHEFLSSHFPAQRFAAVRTLSRLVTRFPLIVTPCSVELEHLITDNNRSIATLAITTLLKTGVESNVDRLMKSISGFMSEISDEFKIVLVDAIKTLCLKFPHKYQTLLTFLASALREEGGYKYKKVIVEAMLTIINKVDESRDCGMENFCEFIEDCEFPELSIKILHLLGAKGPTTSNPAKYIRFIFNRVILETAAVRAAAVSSLARFGASIPSLTDSIMVLLKRCVNDNDDEVRDRAIFYLNILQGDLEEAKIVCCQEPQYNLADLDYSVGVYIENPPSEAFNIRTHLIRVDSGSDSTGTKDDGSKSKPTMAANVDVNSKDFVNPYAELLNSIPEIGDLGKLWKSCAPVDLTEAESEYVVNCVTHIYPEHVVFQFNVTNLMEDQLLENVTVEMEPEDPAWVPEYIIPEASIAYKVAGATFVVLQRPEGVFSTGTTTCNLKFFVKDVDVSTGEIDDVSAEDEYQLEDIEITEANFMLPAPATGLPEFRRRWESMDGKEIVKKYSLGLDNLQGAVDAVLELLGMSAVENSSDVPEGGRSHAVNLVGNFFGGIQVLCRSGFMLDSKHGVTLKIAVRSPDDGVNQMFANAIR